MNYQLNIIIIIMTHIITWLNVNWHKLSLEKVGKITRVQLEEIAKVKEKDLNANTMDQAVKIIAGTARSMGVEVDI